MLNPIVGPTPKESAIAVVDEDCTGTVEFHEFVHLLTIYMKTEGFTRDLAAMWICRGVGGRIAAGANMSFCVFLMFSLRESLLQELPCG